MTLSSVALSTLSGRTLLMLKLKHAKNGSTEDGRATRGCDEHRHANRSRPMHRHAIRGYLGSRHATKIYCKDRHATECKQTLSYTQACKQTLSYTPACNQTLSYTQACNHKVSYTQTCKGKCASNRPATSMLHVLNTRKQLVVVSIMRLQLHLESKPVAEGMGVCRKHESLQSWENGSIGTTMYWQDCQGTRATASEPASRF